MRAEFDRTNAFVCHMLTESAVVAAAVSAYLANPMSDEEYYAAHECRICDPIDHCPHGET